MAVYHALRMDLEERWIAACEELARVSPDALDAVIAVLTAVCCTEPRAPDVPREATPLPSP